MWDLGGMIYVALDEGRGVDYVNADYTDYYLQERVTSYQREMVYLKPGENCGEHSTNAHEEMLVFLQGAGTAVIGENEKKFEVGKGKVAYIPPHMTHNIENTGTEPLVYIYCVTPIK